MRPRDLAALDFHAVKERLAAFARSPAGKEICRALQPSADRSEVAGALDAAWQCVRLIDERGDLPLGDFPDVRGALREAAHEGYLLDGPALVQVRAVLNTALAARQFLLRHAGAYPVLADLLRRLEPLPALRAALERALDDHGQVTDGASDELAAVRQTLRQVREQLTRRLEDLLAQPALGEMIADRFITVRNNRFVVPIRTALAARFAGVVQDRSVSGETTFIEPLFAVELNNRVLIAAKEEEALVRRILADLTGLVRTDRTALEMTFAALAQIDGLAARARFARHYQCTQPALSDDDLELRQARHPLLLFGERPVTPVDLRLPHGRRILLISGPNTGGKTVALKTLGLLAVMAQSGLLLPVAEGSRLPCFGGVYTDVGDEQSIERNLSTFAAHVTNLADILERHDAPALVLLDEPGVGTDPEDGAALGIGMVCALEANGAWIAISTHYTPLKVFALTHPTCVAAAVEFDVAKMEPRYRLVYHSVGESLGLPIARRLGLPSAVLRMAETARPEHARALNDAVSRLEESRRHYEEALQGLNEREVAVDAAQAEAERLLAELRARRRRGWAEDIREAHAFVRGVRERGRALLAEIEHGAADRRALARYVDEQEAAIREHAAELIDAAVPAAPAQVGDIVGVADTDIRGELVAVEGARAWLQRGSMRFEVRADQLRRLGGPPPAGVEVRVEPVAEASPREINLMGLRAKEAVAQLDEFLDHAVRARHPSVRIVHGIGSGALRRAVTEYLARSPYCAAFRGGAGSEGGLGVTIADLSAS